MADYAGLKAEILKPAYAGLDDPSALAAINAPGASVPAPLPLLTLLQWTAATGVRAAIENYANAQKGLAAAAQSPVYAIVLSIQDMFWGAFAAGHVFDVTDPAIAGTGGMLDALVAAGIMTADQKAQVVNLDARPTPPIAAGYGFPAGATAADLTHARSLT